MTSSASATGYPRWSITITSDPEFELMVDLLVEDGMRFAPFDGHQDGSHRFRDLGLTPDLWRRWAAGMMAVRGTAEQMLASKMPSTAVRDFLARNDAPGVIQAVFSDGPVLRSAITAYRAGRLAERSSVGPPTVELDIGIDDRLVGNVELVLSQLNSARIRLYEVRYPVFVVAKVFDSAGFIGMESVAPDWSLILRYCAREFA